MAGSELVDIAVVPEVPREDEPIITEGVHFVLGKLRLRFSTMTAILFIIFMGIVYTKIVMVLSV